MFLTWFQHSQAKIAAIYKYFKNFCGLAICCIIDVFELMQDALLLLSEWFFIIYEFYS